MPRKKKTASAKPVQGRPRKVALMSPEKLAEVQRLHLQGWSTYQIAARFNVNPRTVADHIDAKLRPQWRERLRERFDEEVAKVEYLEKTAWECFEQSLKPRTKEKIEKALVDGGADLKVIKRSLEKVKSTGQTAYLEIVRWCRDYFAKVGGYYKADPLGNQTIEDKSVRPNVVAVVIDNRDQHRAALRFEEFARLAQEQAISGGEVLDLKQPGGEHGPSGSQ